MGKRRMYSKDIVRSDAFLDLPVSSRELYFQLGMDTDDRGYVSNAKSIIRLIGASQGDLEPLIQKGFMMIRGDTLLLQKHFKINNYIQSDRLHETTYLDDLKKLFYEDNGSYTDNPTKGRKIIMDTKCIHDVSKMDTEDKISKDKISKDKEIYKDIPLFCESCVKKIFSCKYLAMEEYADQDRYLELFSLLLENYAKKNIVISLNYFIFQVCSRKWNEEKKCFEYEGIREDYAIDDKYSYLRTSLYNSCEKFKDGYEAYLDKTNAYFDKVLECAKLQYDYEDSKIEEFKEGK